MSAANDIARAVYVLNHRLVKMQSCDTVDGWMDGWMGVGGCHGENEAQTIRHSEEGKVRVRESEREKVTGINNVSSSLPQSGNSQLYLSTHCRDI